MKNRMQTLGSPSWLHVCLIGLLLGVLIGCSAETADPTAATLSELKGGNGKGQANGHDRDGAVDEGTDVDGAIDEDTDVDEGSDEDTDVDDDGDEGVDEGADSDASVDEDDDSDEGGDEGVDDDEDGDEGAGEGKPDGGQGRGKPARP